MWLCVFYPCYICQTPCLCVIISPPLPVSLLPLASPPFHVKSQPSTHETHNKKLHTVTPVHTISLVHVWHISTCVWLSNLSFTKYILTTLPDVFTSCFHIIGSCGTFLWQPLLKKRMTYFPRFCHKIEDNKLAKIEFFAACGQRNSTKS